MSRFTEAAEEQARRHHNDAAVTNSIFDGLAACGFFDRPENFHDARLVGCASRAQRPVWGPA
jgi:hypothetical protein